MAAGIIWVVYGVLSIIGTVATYAQPARNQDAPLGTCCGGMIGIAFLVVGYLTVTGKAKDTRGNGVGSFVLGLLALLGAAVLGFGGADQGKKANEPVPPEEDQLIIAAIVAVFACTLILAGILALAGRNDYFRWRADNASDRRRWGSDRHKDATDNSEGDDRDERPLDHVRGNGQ